MKHWCAGFGDNKNFTCIIYPDEPPKRKRYHHRNYEIMTMCGRVLHDPIDDHRMYHKSICIRIPYHTSKIYFYLRRSFSILILLR